LNPPSIIWIGSGHFIQISSWRDPHPIVNFTDVLRNIKIIEGYFLDHASKFFAIVTPSIFVLLCSYMLFKLRSMHDFLLILLALICALSVYVSAIPLGIIIQERTTVTFWVACICAIFIRKNISKEMRCVGIILAVVLAAKTAQVSQSSISWYSKTTDVMIREFHSAMPYKIDDVKKVYIVVNNADAKTIFKKIDSDIHYRKYFSEDLDGPLNWLAILKYLGFNKIKLCINGGELECEAAVKVYQEMGKTENSDNFFLSHKFGENVVFSINEARLKI
jgi:hypothetical protein